VGSPLSPLLESRPTDWTETNTGCQSCAEDVAAGCDDRGVSSDGLHGYGAGGAGGDGGVYDESLDVGWQRRQTTCDSKVMPTGH
jgi:hypothetical protein